MINAYRERDDGTEYWSARELAPTLEYIQWRNFTKVIGRAMIANLFRISQTEEKLRKDRVKGAEYATSIHYLSLLNLFKYLLKNFGKVFSA